MRVKFFYIKLAIAFFLLLPFFFLMKLYLRPSAGTTLKQKVEEDTEQEVQKPEYMPSVHCEEHEFSDTLNLIRGTLPHLRRYPSNDLLPKVLFGSLKKKKLVMAISVVRGRSRFYLSQTLRSLLKWIDIEDRGNASIVIFLRSDHKEFVDSVLNVIKLEFRESVDNGILQVLQSPPQLQPATLEDLPQTHNDSASRREWRTRQNIDYFYMMSYASHFGDYYLQLEDDIIAQKDYLQNVLFYLEAHKEKESIMMEFAELGFIGRGFRSSDVQRLAQAISIFYRYKPVDWILGDFLLAHYCGAENNKQSCFQRSYVRYIPSLFNHAGFYSTREGQVQKLKELYYNGKHRNTWKGNHPAHVTSSFPSSGKYSAQDCYNHPLFYQIDSQKIGNSIDISIKRTRIQGVLVTTGTDEEPTKVLKSTVSVFAKPGGNGPPELLGPFEDRGRFQAFLRCRELDGFEIRAMDNSQQEAILTNLMIIPC